MYDTEHADLKGVEAREVREVAQGAERVIPRPKWPGLRLVTWGMLRLVTWRVLRRVRWARWLRARSELFEALIASSSRLFSSPACRAEFKNNYSTEMCSGSEAGSYLRLIDFCIAQL